MDRGCCETAKQKKKQKKERGTSDGEAKDKAKEREKREERGKDVSHPFAYRAASRPLLSAQATDCQCVGVYRPLCSAGKWDVHGDVKLELSGKQAT